MLYLEKLPKYLKHDIEMIEKYDRKTSSLYDCYLEELWGSINACMYDGVISPAEAENLRQNYYWKNLSKGEE